MNFSQSKYSRLKLRLRKKYQLKLKNHSKLLKTFSSNSFSKWFLKHKSDFKDYSPLNWYFLVQAETYIFFLENIIPKSDDDDDDDDDFSLEEELIFDKWNNSEFADTFLKMLNAGNSVKKSSEATFKILEQHLIGLGERHILKTNKLNALYRAQSSLGDFKKGNKLSKLLETTLHLEGKDLNLMTNSLEEMKQFSQKIEIALKIIKNKSPSSYDRFKAFTETIIPIKDEEFVSYSHQELPGTSMINMYNRDFVDLLDDLLHENGHHHLNYYLNLQKLIVEPIDNIYYSPWRRTLRPLRGIYHAYFTFFWALKFFSDLSSCKEMDSIFYLFSSREKEKIFFRAIEEYYMLNYTFQDLKWAKKNGLISATGWNLVQEQQKLISKLKPKINLWEKNLRSHKKDIVKLKKNLLEAKKTYLKIN